MQRNDKNQTYDWYILVHFNFNTFLYLQTVGASYKKILLLQANDMYIYGAS